MKLVMETIKEKYCDSHLSQSRYQALFIFKCLDTDFGCLPMDNEASCSRAIFTLQIM